MPDAFTQAPTRAWEPLQIQIFTKAFLKNASIDLHEKFAVA